MHHEPHPSVSSIDVESAGGASVCGEEGGEVVPAESSRATRATTASPPLSPQRGGRVTAPLLGEYAGRVPLNRVTVLELVGCGVGDLGAVASLHSLEYLIVARNRLTAIPDAVMALPALWVVEAAHNAITTFPTVRKAMGAIGLRANGITDLPSSPALVCVELALGGNPVAKRVGRKGLLELFPHILVLDGVARGAPPRPLPPCKIKGARTQRAQHLLQYLSDPARPEPFLAHYTTQLFCQLQSVPSQWMFSPHNDETDSVPRPRIATQSAAKAVHHVNTALFPLPTASHIKMTNGAPFYIAYWVHNPSAAKAITTVLSAAIHYPHMPPCTLHTLIVHILTHTKASFPSPDPPPPTALSTNATEIVSGCLACLPNYCFPVLLYLLRQAIPDMPPPPSGPEAAHATYYLIASLNLLDPPSATLNTGDELPSKLCQEALQMEEYLRETSEMDTEAANEEAAATAKWVAKQVFRHELMWRNQKQYSAGAGSLREEYPAMLRPPPSTRPPPPPSQPGSDTPSLLDTIGPDTSSSYLMSGLPHRGPLRRRKAGSVATAPQTDYAFILNNVDPTLKRRQVIPPSLRWNALVLPYMASADSVEDGKNDQATEVELITGRLPIPGETVEIPGGSTLVVLGVQGQLVDVIGSPAPVAAPRDAQGRLLHSKSPLQTRERARHERIARQKEVLRVVAKTFETPPLPSPRGKAPASPPSSLATPPPPPPCRLPLHLLHWHPPHRAWRLVPRLVPGDTVHGDGGPPAVVISTGKETVKLGAGSAYDSGGSHTVEVALHCISWSMCPEGLRWEYHHSEPRAAEEVTSERTVRAVDRFQADYALGELCSARNTEGEPNATVEPASTAPGASNSEAALVHDFYAASNDLYDATAPKWSNVDTSFSFVLSDPALPCHPFTEASLRRMSLVRQKQALREALRSEPSSGRSTPTPMDCSASLQGARKGYAVGSTQQFLPTTFRTQLAEAARLKETDKARPNSAALPPRPSSRPASAIPDPRPRSASIPSLAQHTPRSYSTSPPSQTLPEPPPDVPPPSPPPPAPSEGFAAKTGKRPATAQGPHTSPTPLHRGGSGASGEVALRMLRGRDLPSKERPASTATAPSQRSPLPLPLPAPHLGIVRPLWDPLEKRMRVFTRLRECLDTGKKICEDIAAKAREDGIVPSSPPTQVTLDRTFGTEWVA